ncbi:MAG: 2-oxoglutarate dehydrogenase E1 component [Thermoflavifilum sp.]|nr:2-oxoglutarate dehydrogenase E1 component [Thermoflavifilum sp.]MCL6514132.1 2-oxoglutarate dehydrogenase E1 component [Alicyclobacillus sp.]
MSDTASALRTDAWRSFFGANLGYAAELYERYLADPGAVDPETRAFFETWGAPPEGEEPATTPAITTSIPVSPATMQTPASLAEINRVVSAHRLVRNIRQFGHLAARINPLQDTAPYVPALDPATYQLTEADLRNIPARWIWTHAPEGVQTALDAVVRLRDIYTGTLAYDFAHVHEEEEYTWLLQTVESGAFAPPRTPEERKALLARLIEVEEFEKFLHRTFVGQKRFSIEGVDVMVPMLDELIKEAVHAGTRHVMIGMAHRGRLNVLAHVLGKPYGIIFSEFHASPNKELVPSEGSMGINYGWTGDVKYHLGARRTMKEGEIVQARLTLANNPSHLEFVNPVVEGFARAAQDDRTKPGAPVQDVDAALAVLIHGDAAFPGEGIVAETLNLSRLRGYQTGGTIHIIANNQLGFTAEADEGRSTRYASDLAKGFEIPVVHVNADDPEACLAAICLAFAYRRRFRKDFLIDLVGYRRWGHNEMDDPVMTQPQLYAKIHQHPSVRHLYARALQAEGLVTEQEIKEMEAAVEARLKKAYDDVTAGQVSQTVQLAAGIDNGPAPETAVPLEKLREINDALLTWPEGFKVYPKLDRILQRRRNAFDEGGKVDWAHAEALAFATILADGTPIRLTGQDSERGTFGQRHLVLHDVESGQEYCPLHGLPQAKASFAIHNSPLSEAAIIGFEYGYNVQAPETLVLWEAQFGDFANAGQVLIDQFISSGRAKWAQQSGLVLLLPHGYEGQGPEHSSARLERYLQLSAENNWWVANVTTAAQYFHLLRLQAARLKTNPKPLVLMTPKSLLRNPRAASSVQELASSRFQPVLDDPRAIDKQNVRRLILCSGKVSVDLFNALEALQPAPDWLAVVRVELLYPFPEDELLQTLAQYPNVEEMVWVQEEPQNMGAWTYMAPRLEALVSRRIRVRYVGRPERSSPAEGVADAHDKAQKQIIDEALTPDALGSIPEAGRTVR